MLVRGVAIGFLIVSAVALPASAQARKSAVRALVAPTRRADATALRDEAARVTRLLAARVGGSVLATDDGEAALEELAILQRAQRLAASGALDDAAAVFDAALEAAEHAPARLGDSAELVSAHIARAAIAFARGESGRADELIERVLRFDPGFALLPTEDSPRMRRAVDEARRRLGPQPELRASDLGQSCGGEASVLVVARALSADRAELVRFDDCKMITTAALRSGVDDDQLVTALLSPAERRRVIAAALTVPPPPPPPVIAPDLPPPPETPFYHRAWFWTVIGAVAAGSAAAVWATQRDKDTVHVVPHL
jgi:tetratricopeptide (TPR) repeat protein